MRRRRNAKIVATLGPESSRPEQIAALFTAGADVFRLNFSHGEADEQRERIDAIRALERERGRPIAILADLQGPKLRVGEVVAGGAELVAGRAFRLDLDPAAGDDDRVSLPHPEVFEALAPGMALLLDDGRLRLRVTARGAEHLDTVVEVGGTLTSRKGLNAPDAVLDLSPLTARDESDLDCALAWGADWIAVSFVQRPEDLDQVRERVGNAAALMAKIEKPSALERIEEVVARADGLMVARGDLGVELPPERVPAAQKRIVRACREAGKPVVVATQMLESMIDAPLPTRAEASDVATAVYDGADAMMLSGETAVGAHPREAVAMMDRIITEVERDPHYRALLAAQHAAPSPTHADAICEALRAVAETLPVAAIVAYTSSGYSALRVARERTVRPIVGLTPSLATARRLALAWGVHAVPGDDVAGVQEMVERATAAALADGFASPGDSLLIMAGMPFGRAGTTNLLRIAEVGAAPAQA